VVGGQVQDQVTVLLSCSLDLQRWTVASTFITYLAITVLQI